MGAINAVTDLTAQGDVAVLTVNSPPVNALSQQVRDGIAYLSLLANPHDEAALYATLTSPFWLAR